MSTKAVFFDRDGVIIQDTHLISSSEQIHLIEGSARVISSLREKGFKTFMVSNQTVVSRGILTLSQMNELNQQILTLLKVIDSNAIFDDVYICPHHPKADVEEFRVECDCRKPRPGMILDASRKFDIDLSKSFMIGDRVSDIIAGNKAGCTTIHLQSGQHEAKMIETTIETSEEEARADYVIQNIEEVCHIVEEASQ